MLLEQIKKQMMQALKGHRTVEKEVLRVVIGETEMAMVKGSPSTDETTMGIVRKLIKSNEETIALTTDAERNATLNEEIKILKAFLPASLSVDDLVAALEPLREQIRAAGNDGQATGIAMKHFKSTGANASGKDVGDAVKKIRA